MNSFWTLAHLLANVSTKLGAKRLYEHVFRRAVVKKSFLELELLTNSRVRQVRTVRIVLRAVRHVKRRTERSGNSKADKLTENKTSYSSSVSAAI